MATLIQALQEKILCSTQLLRGATPQILFGLSILSCLYLLRTQQKEAPKPDPEPPKKEKKSKIRSSSQKQLDDSDEKQDLIAKLKKSQRQFNKKLNHHFDDSIDITEEIIPRSPDYSVVSEVDQQFFQELIQNKKQNRKQYQTDCEGSVIKLRKRFKQDQILVSEDDKRGEDRLFFQLQSRVIEQEEDENDNDQDSN